MTVIDTTSPPTLPPEWTRCDQLIAVSFLLLALLLHYCLTGWSTPLVIPNTDSGNVAGFIAGWLYPEVFSEDLVLADPANFRFYVTLVIPIVMFMHWLVQDIGTAFCAIVVPIIFFQCLGFYRLGLALSFGPMLAVVLALVTLTPVGIISGEFWGLFHTPLVRMTYGAALPWLLLLMFDSRVSLFKLMTWSALASYLHLVSGPGLAFALLCGRLVFENSRLGLAKGLLTLLGPGCWYLLLLAPYVIVYIFSFPSLGVATDPNLPNLAYQGWDEVTAYTSVGMALQQLLHGGIGNPYSAWGWRGWAALLTILGLFALAFNRGANATDGSRNQQAKVILMVLAGCVFASIGITSLDQSIARLTGREPLQADLIRNVKFVVPLLFLGFVWLLAVTVQRIQTMILAGTISAAWLPHGVRAVGLIVLTAWTLPYFLHTNGDLLNAVGTPPTPLAVSYISDAPAAVRFLRSRKNAGTVLVLGREELGLAVRYAGRHSVAWLQKDRNALFYSSSESMREWQHRRQLLGMITAPRVTDAVTQAAGAALCRFIAEANVALILLDHGKYPRMQYLPHLAAGDHVWTSRNVQITDAQSVAKKSCRV